MTQDELNAALAQIIARLDEINTFYIHKVAEQIKKIGTLNASSINRLSIMAEMGADVNEINNRIMQAAGLNARTLFSVYSQILNDTYADTRFARYSSAGPLPTTDRARLTQYARLVSAQTANTMVNLSNTTAVSTSYQAAVDKAIYAVSTGVTDYKAATRQAIQEIGYNGLQVRYDSGYHRRMDSAIRQNIIDGANQLAQQSSLMMGDALGYDAVEISAHARSAPDHEPVQGRVFLKSEFDRMQNGQDFVDVDGNRYAGFKRPIGEWNCMHIAMSFSTQHSVRRYSDAQLADWKKANNEGVTIEGKKYTVYQAVQKMREIETEIRRQKDTAVAATAAGDNILRQSCQTKINALTAHYNAFAKSAGITPRRDRLMVQGFRAVKVLG
jgi:hypothetical protein